MSRRLDPPRSVEQGGAGGGVGSFLSSVAALSFGGWGATLNAGASPSRSPSPPARRARRSSGWDDSTAPEERPRSQVLTTRRAPRIAPLDAPPPLARARTAGQSQQPELVASPYAVRSAAAQPQTHLSGPRLSALASPRHSVASRPSSSVARVPVARKQRDDVSVRGVSRGSVEYSAAPPQPPPAAQRPPFQPPVHLPAPPPTPPQRWLSPPRQMVADDTASAAVSANVPMPSPEASQADDLRDDCGGGAAEPPGVAMRHDDVAPEPAPAEEEEEQLDGWALLFGAAGETVQTRCASDAGATQVIVDVTHQPAALLRWLRRSQMAAGAASLTSTGRGGSPPVMPRGTYPGRSSSPSRNNNRFAATPAANTLASTLATGDGDPPSWQWLTPGQATALRLFTAAQAPHLLLLGGPGSGKSWALSAMAATYAFRARAAVPQSGGSGQDHALRRTAPQPQSRGASSRGSPSGAGARFVLCCAPTAPLAYRTFGPASASPPVVVMSIAAALAKAATSRSWLAGADAVLVDNALGPLSPQAASSLASLLTATSAARATMRRPAPVFVLAGDPGDGRGVYADAPWGYATSCPEVASCLDLTRARGHHTAVDDTARGCAALMLTSAPGHGVFAPTDTAAVAHLARWLAAAHALRRAAVPDDDAGTHVDALRALLPAAATPNRAGVTLTWGPRLSADVAQPQRRGAVPLPHPCVDLAWADSGSRQRDKGGSSQPPTNSPGAKAAASAAWDAMPVPLRRCAGDGTLLLGGDVAPGDVVFACAPLLGQLQHSTGRAGAPRPKVMVSPGALGTVTAVTAAPSGQWAESVTVAFHIAPPPQQPPASSAQTSAATAAGVRRRGWTTAVCQVAVRSTAAFPFSARHSVAMSGVRPGVATGIYLPLLPLVTLHMGGDASHEDVDTASLAQLLQSASAGGGDDPTMVSGCHVDVDSCRALGHMAAAVLPASVTSLAVREAAASGDGDGDSPLAALAAAAAAAHRCLFGPGMDVTPVPAVSPSTPQALPPPRAALPPVVAVPAIELPLPPPPPPPLAQTLPRAPAAARPAAPPALVTVPAADDVATASTGEEDKAAALATAVRTVQLLHHLHTARSALVASLDATMSPRGTGQAGGRDSVPKTPRFAAELAIPAFVPPQPQPPAPPQPQPPAPAPAPTPRPAPQAALPPGWSAEPLAYLQAPGTSQAAILSAVEHAGPSPFDAIRAAAAAAGEEGAAAVRNMLRRAEERAATNTSPSRK